MVHSNESSKQGIPSQLLTFLPSTSFLYTNPNADKPYP